LSKFNFDKYIRRSCNFGRKYRRSYNFDKHCRRSCNFGKNVAEVITSTKSVTSARHIYRCNDFMAIPTVLLYFKIKTHSGRTLCTHSQSVDALCHRKYLYQYIDMKDYLSKSQVIINFLPFSLYLLLQ